MPESQHSVHIKSRLAEKREKRGRGSFNQTIGVAFSEEMMTQLRTMAEQQDRPICWIIRKIVIEGLSALKPTNLETPHA